ncbi:MAG: glycosyltransferase [Spirochaetaceae bacterium]|jgi:hypothetical protein|nr:glycosyltransferase [Spirochaetaceae bacterium]
MFNITVLTFVDRISCFYSLSPFLFNRDKRFSFTYTSDAAWCLENDRNSILVMMRQFIKPDAVDIGLLERLRAKYDRIAFFHDDAGGGIPRLEALPHADLFYSKALFRDRALYGRKLYGKELYSDYYHEKYGVTDPDYRPRAVETDPAQLAKLRLSWNIGIGDYPRDQLRQRAGVALSRMFGVPPVKLLYRKNRFDPERALKNNKSLYPVHARVGLISRPSISYQRKLILDRIEGNPLFLTGRVPQARFNREVANSRIILSPFGWGELCLRDFETVRSGALLLKPDMGHIETWPDIFVPGETYVPFDWDAEELAAKADYYLAHENERRGIAENAAQVYAGASGTVQERFSSIMEEICR